MSVLWYCLTWYCVHHCDVLPFNMMFFSMRVMWHYCKGRGVIFYDVLPVHMLWWQCMWFYSIAHDVLSIPESDIIAHEVMSMTLIWYFCAWFCVNDCGVIPFHMMWFQFFLYVTIAHDVVSIALMCHYETRCCFNFCSVIPLHRMWYVMWYP